MHDYTIEILGKLVPEKTNIVKFRNDKNFLFVRAKDKKILVLNPTAREIYGLCDGRTVGQIIKVMNSFHPNINKKKM